MTFSQCIKKLSKIDNELRRLEKSLNNYPKNEAGNLTNEAKRTLKYQIEKEQFNQTLKRYRKLENYLHIEFNTKKLTG